VTGIALLCAATVAAAPAEPPLSEAQAAAARAAGGGSSADDEARTSRLRRSHWAPVLRGELLRRDELRNRAGELRGYPLRQDDAALTNSWSITLTWDFAQLVYAREESQLALAHVHLARVRRQAAERAAELWIERRQRTASLATLAGLARREAALELLRVTAELDAVTGGLYREVLRGEEAQLAGEAP
jgi:hypothetical protein